ncbi:hypothetical protein ACFOEE_00535 [Pseudoalteromonas fenneropenaei]|uniref:Uncharacterized protein n=1 Tax=Pseudoalteromonas fenneropenaei TaxID=1737459 RepID=A0ABV7CCJ2_9GAMM
MTCFYTQLTMLLCFMALFTSCSFAQDSASALSEPNKLKQYATTPVERVAVKRYLQAVVDYTEQQEKCRATSRVISPQQLASLPTQDESQVVQILSYFYFETQQICIGEGVQSALATAYTVARVVYHNNNKALKLLDDLNYLVFMQEPEQIEASLAIQAISPAVIAEFRSSGLFATPFNLLDSVETYEQYK